MRTVKRVVAACLIVVMGAQATGCHTWRAVTEPVPAAVARYPNRKIQVIGISGGTRTADSARVVADAILAFGGEVNVVDRSGIVLHSYKELTDTIPLAWIQSVKVRLPSPGRTIAAILVPVAALVGLALYMALEWEYSL